MNSLPGLAMLLTGPAAGAAAPALGGAAPLLAGVVLPDASAPQPAAGTPPFAAMLAAQPVPAAGRMPGDAAPSVPIDGASVGGTETEPAELGPGSGFEAGAEPQMDLATPAPWLLQLVPELSNLPTAIAVPPLSPAATPWPSPAVVAARLGAVAGGRGWQASLPAAPDLKARSPTSAEQPAPQLAPQVASAPTISLPVAAPTAAPEQATAGYPADTLRSFVSVSMPAPVQAPAAFEALPLPGAAPMQPMVPSPPPSISGKLRGSGGPATVEALPEAALPADVASARRELAPETREVRAFALPASDTPAASQLQSSPALAVPPPAPTPAPANLQPVSSQPATPAPAGLTEAAPGPVQPPGLSIASERLGQVAVQLNGGPDQLQVAMQAQPAAAALIGGEGQRLQQDLAAAGVMLAGLSVNGQRADLSGGGRRAPRQSRAGIESVAGAAPTRAAPASLLPPAPQVTGGVTIDRLA